MVEECEGAARRGRPPMTDKRRDLQRLAIARHAVRLFREQGMAATTGEQIAAAAGISERTLWRYFRSKESCVEPLLTRTVDALESALLSWPADVDLVDHLHAVYRFLPGSSRTDRDAVLAVVRMSRDEPALRASWLAVQERAEPTFATVLGLRNGVSPDTLEMRMRAAILNTALRVATDEFAWATTAKCDGAAVERHRGQLAHALRIATQVSADAAAPSCGYDACATAALPG